MDLYGQARQRVTSTLEEHFPDYDVDFGTVDCQCTSPALRLDNYKAWTMHITELLLMSGGPTRPLGDSENLAASRLATGEESV